MLFYERTRLQRHPLCRTRCYPRHPFGGERVSILGPGPLRIPGPTSTGTGDMATPPHPDLEAAPIEEWPAVDCVVREPGINWAKADTRLGRDGSLDPTAKALYLALTTYADIDLRHTPADYRPPTRRELAACIGKSVDTVDRATKTLEAYGMLRVLRRRDPSGKSNLPNVYQLLDARQWARRDLERAEQLDRELEALMQGGGGRTDAAPPGRTGAAPPGRTDAAHSQEPNQDPYREPAAPAARSATRRRQPPVVGGDGGDPEGREDDRQAVKEAPAALRGLPAELAPYAGERRVLQQAAMALRRSRTAAEINARILRRWERRPLDPIADPRAYLIRLIQSACPDDMCEDGTLVHTGQPCARCDERAPKRRRL